jgi:hypothetical protein
MWNLVGVAWAGTFNFQQPFQSFHGSLMGAGAIMFSCDAVWMAVEYRLKHHVDHLMAKAVPLLISAGMIVYSLPAGQAMIPGSGAAAATGLALPVPMLLDLVTDSVAGSLYWGPLLWGGMRGWRRLWRR